MMSQPIVYISRFAVNEGKLDDFKELSREALKSLEAEKPRTLVFLAYLDEGGTDLTIVHVFGDAEAMDLHVEGSEERASAAYELVEPRGFDIYGRPSRAVLEMMQGYARPDAPLTLTPDLVAGFIRPVATTSAR
jgi:quinol monooxygenase YgiN